MKKIYNKCLPRHGSYAIHYMHMKMTMFVDDELLARVMAATGAETKTKAVDLALREMDRRARLVKLATAGLGMSAMELKEAVDPAYSLENMRRMEGPVNYGGKSRTR
jgi:Arc/MetJ family transcription regulator